MNEELKASIKKKLMQNMNSGLNPLIPKMLEIIASAYETGFWAGFDIGLSVEPKEEK